MSGADQPLGRVAAEWTAKLPATKEEGEAQGFDGRIFLAGWLEAAARDKAEEAFLGLNDFMAGGQRTVDNLGEHVMAHGLTLLETWGSIMLRAGTDHEPWAREAANRAALVYRDRIAELMATSIPEGRS